MEEPSPSAGTPVVYAASGAHPSPAAALAEVAQQLQTAASQEGAEIVSVSHTVTVVTAGDAPGGMKTAFTGKSGPREYVVTALAVLKA